LRVKWADAGFNFETSTLSALETAANGYEIAETIRRLETTKHAEAATARSSGPQASSKKSSAFGVSSSTTTQRSRLTNEERDRFRTENGCFYCREIGHSKHNCPLLHEAPAPKVRSGVANVLEDRYAYLRSLSLDLLTREKQAARELYTFSFCCCFALSVSFFFFSFCS
jgi:hypothetical protein